MGAYACSSSLLLSPVLPQRGTVPGLGCAGAVRGGGGGGLGLP